MRSILILCLTIIQFLHSSCSPLERRCFASDTKCLTARAQEYASLFVKGIPNIHVERLDPMCIDYIKKEKEGLILEGWNNRLEGLSNAIIDELSIDMSSKVMRLVFHAEKFLFTNKYKIDGLLFTMPICGEGDLYSFERNKNVALTMPFDILVDSKGHSFMNLKNFTYNFETKDGAHFHLTNLYYGDQAKSVYTHNYLNKNWKLITQIFPPLILDDICFKIFNAVATFMRSRPLQDLLL